VRLGATADGKLVSLIHDGITQSNEICDYAERFTRSSRTLATRFSTEVGGSPARA